MKRLTFRGAAFIAVALMLLFALSYCGEEDRGAVPVSITFGLPGGDGAGPAKALQKPAPSIVSSISVNISAPDLAAISDVFNVTAGSTVTRNYLIAPGQERTFSATAYEGPSATGVPFYEGSATVELIEGSPATVVITMAQVPGKFVDVSRGDDNLADNTPIIPYKTITAALSASAGNEPIHVATGFYNLSSGESFPLQLNAGTALKCYGTGYSTVIDRQEIYYPAIQGAAGASIDSCRIINSWSAVDDAGAQMLVTNNLIEYYCDAAIYISANSTISGNTIREPAIGDCLPDGIVVSSAVAVVTPVVSNNKITNNNNGIFLSQNGNPTISGNSITENSRGINIGSTSRGKINNNLLSCNTQYDLVSFSTYTTDASNNRWDHSTPTEDVATTCGPNFDICNGGFAGSIDYSGSSLAPSPCL